MGVLAPEDIEAVAMAVWQYQNRTLTTMKPDNPESPELCRVTAEVLDGMGNAIGGILFVFELIVPSPSKVHTLVTRSVVRAQTRNDGKLMNDDYMPWLDLQRNDRLVPAGSYWTVTCTAIGFKQTPFTLTGESFDLMTLIEDPE